MVTTLNPISAKLADRNSEEFRTLFETAVHEYWTPEQLGWLVERPERYAHEYRRYRAEALLVNKQGKRDLDADAVLLLDGASEPDDAIKEWVTENVIVEPARDYQTTPNHLAVDCIDAHDWEPKRLLALDGDGLAVSLNPVRRAEEDGRKAVLFSVEYAP